MTDLINRIKIFFLTIFCSLIFIPALQSQEIKRDNSPVINDENHYFLEGIREFNNRNFYDSKRAFMKTILKNRENDAAYYYLAYIALEEKDIPTAEMMLKTAIEKDSTNFWYKDLLAKIYISTENTDQAIDVYEGLSHQFPKKKEVFYNLTNLYIGKEDVEKAHLTLDKIENSSGKNEGIIMARFNLFRMSDDMGGALSYLLGTGLQNSSPRIGTIIGDIYAERHQDSIAMAYYKNVLEIEPEYIPAIYGEAEAYRRKGEYPMFFKRISHIILNPQIESSMKHNYLGQLLQIPGFVNKCKASLDTLMENLADTHPTDSLTNHLASAYFAQTGNKDKCRELLRKICYRTPLDKYARMQYLSYLYFENGWEDLKRETQQALLAFPSDMDILQMHGIAQYQTGNMDEAVGTYNKMREIALANRDTSNIVACHSMLGDLYHEAGNTKMAYSHYEKALKFDPGYNPVLNNYAYFLALENKSLKKAYKMSRKSIESEPDNPTYLDTFAWILHLMGRSEEAKGHIKHAMLYGGMESADILDHYAEILYALKEYDLAFMYWEQAHKKDNTLGLDKKIEQRRKAMNNN